MSVVDGVRIGTSHDPRTGAELDGPQQNSADEVSAAVRDAAASAAAVAATPPSERQRWLEEVSHALEAAADELVAIADEETALGEARLRGELGRTARQMRFYGAVAQEGSWYRAQIDAPADPVPVDLRRVAWSLGPVAVFGASNFPFMFGVAGHDTASALAAGCPVVAKAHPAHPRLSVRIAEVVSAALRDAGAPQGTFALVVGFDAGTALVDAPEISAVAFTGSQRGGIALVDRARARPRPIPVFAEMGTVNPVVLTPAHVRRGLRETVEGFVESFTRGTGQFCTKPGLLLVPRGTDVAAVAREVLPAVPTGWLLTEQIAQAYKTGVERIVAAGGRLVAEGPAPADGYRATPTLFAVSADDFDAGSPLLEECFGPVALIAEYDDGAHLRQVLAELQPSLAASVFGAGDDDPDLQWLVPLLAGQVGRVAVDEWPTGVAVSWAQQHGGPWPATSRPDTTSVGAGALERFTRPVTFQDVPQAALPEPLRDANPWRVPRRVGGRAEESPAG